MSSIAEIYEIRFKSGEDLQWLLAQSREVFDLLFEIPAKVKEFFREEPWLALVPAFGGQEYIGVIIKTYKDVPDALKALDEFDNWWIEACYSTGCTSILVATEYYSKE